MSIFSRFLKGKSANKEPRAQTKGKPPAMQVYFNDSFGYILCAKTTLKGTPIRTVIEPVTVLNRDTAAAILGCGILDSLEASRNARPITHEELGNFRFWHISGIKGFASFSRKFQCVSVEQSETVLRLEKLIRDTDGGYIQPDTPPAEVSADCTMEQLGAIVLELFSVGQAQPVSQTISFETLHGRTVTYRRPSDGFTDCGDGHTDAYQIFSFENAPENHIAFLIDSGYSELSEAAIKRRWRQMFGELLEFRFQAHQGAGPMAVIQGRTDIAEITSYIYPDGEGTMEVMSLIDLTWPQKLQEALRAEYESVLASISIC